MLDMTTDYEYARGELEIAREIMHATQGSPQKDKDVAWDRLVRARSGLGRVVLNLMVAAATMRGDEHEMLGRFNALLKGEGATCEGATSSMGELFEEVEWLYEDFPDKGSTWRMIKERHAALRVKAEALYAQVLLKDEGNRP